MEPAQRVGVSVPRVQVGRLQQLRRLGPAGLRVSLARVVSARAPIWQKWDVVSPRTCDPVLKFHATKAWSHTPRPYGGG
eukprot:52901-Chlamydomonas_euryale.AAC.2